MACRTGNAKIVSVLLEFGATPTSVDEYGVTPLHWYQFIVSIILVSQIAYARTLINRAANSGKPKILNSLLNKGKLGSVDLAKKDQYGSTPLHFASVRNLAESVQTLVWTCDVFYGSLSVIAIDVPKWKTDCSWK